MSALAKELDDLKIADKVLASLGQSDDDDIEEHISQRHREKSNLTIADQIVATSESEGPLDSRSLYLAVIHKFGKELAYTSFASTLSRMKTIGKIELDKNLWFVPKTNSASSEFSLEAVEDQSGRAVQSGAD